jgi:transposase-like protein
MHRSYTSEQKAQAVGTALAVGSKRASHELGIPRRTIDYWINHPEFAELRQRAREDVADQMWAGVQIAIVEVVDALTNPKVPLRDKAQALDVLFKQHALLTGAATSRTEARDITGTLSDAELIAALREAERLTSEGGAASAPADAPAG